MTDFRSQFNTWYFNQFRFTNLYSKMEETVEDSPWHREANVAVHTDMVVGQYVGMAPILWTKSSLLGAIACAFHDVGKPAAEEVRHSEQRGTYRRYAGHELVSARLWEDYVCSNWKYFVDTFDLEPMDIYRVGWVIEHHLPYGIKKKDKVKTLLRTAIETVGDDVFARVLRADTLGKISDDHAEKIRGNEEWLHEFFTRPSHPNIVENDAPALIMLIGASGVGKSTFTMTLDHVLDHQKTSMFSWDQLRLDWYVDKDDRKLSNGEQYRIAFEKSTHDKQFNAKANQEYIKQLKIGMDVVVDNTNTSNKRRKFFITEARNRGYKIVAVMFPIELNALLARQDSRTDKTVPTQAVIRQYKNTQYPFFGDFDTIRVLSTNL